MNGLLNATMQRHLAWFGLKDLLQFSERSGPRLLDLVTSSTYGPHPACAFTGCLLCAGRNLSNDRMPLACDGPGTEHGFVVCA